MKLEDIKIGAKVAGIAPNGSVDIVAVEWIGSQAVNVAFRSMTGGIEERTLYRDDEVRLNLEIRGKLWSFDGNGENLRLVTEANRIKLAFFFDPFLAIHTSLVDPLPHQISAVYGEMLPRQPLRFLLADDPGAGKTIMAGLLIKELLARSDLERCLIVAPGSLVEQWQDELGEKFDLEFEILSRDMIENSRSGNPFNDKNRLIVRLDVLARNEDLQDKLESSEEWDLVICDEAHRMSASAFGGEIKYTKRYQAGQKLGQVCRHFLLMTATPHNGKEEEFQLFMALLDGDRFEGRFRDGVHFSDTNDMMRRLTKEELLKFDGRPLFPERRAYTVKYELTPEESKLYASVTEYVRHEMGRVQRFAETDNRKRNTVGFALMILQRRLASSPAAIYESLKRRRGRLEDELGEARLAERGKRATFDLNNVDSDKFENMEEYEQYEIDDFEEFVTTGATAAETAEQLEIEVETLKDLERMALAVLNSGQDTKWNQLNKILDDELMTDSEGNRRKLIIFTEPKDTLYYLEKKVKARIGKAEAVEVIHGGVGREDRRRIVERFMQDKDMLVLIANDAAGEGVNLQRGHLMVNYDLPWNPNKIEQRFGRIHRIGQTEICHLWNLVAAETREGQVYGRLLEKLETAREALGGRVYDVLGELFEGTPLRDLLKEAIQYGEQDEVRAKLFEKVDGVVDQDHLIELIRKRSLTQQTLPEARVKELRLEMERADAQRLQPHHVESFFIEAFQNLGGQIKTREDGRWEITHVPLRIRDRDRQTGSGAAVQKKYERICFEKDKIHQQPVAKFIYPGHPLIEAVISLVREDFGKLMTQGAVLVDDSDFGQNISAVFLLEHSVKDGRPLTSDRPHIISQKLQFASVDQNGDVSDAGIAPHLNLRPINDTDIELVREDLDAKWLNVALEKKVINFATVELAQTHLKEVRNRRLPEIEKVRGEVNVRLKKEINHWDSRAFEEKEKEKAGKKTRLNWQNAERRANNIAERLKARETLLDQEMFISSLPPKVRGGMLVIPRGLLDLKRVQKNGEGKIPFSFAESAAARKAIELKAMESVMDAERALGRQPKDVSGQKVGYDIESYCPKTQKPLFIEVKGRIEGADSVMLTRNEIIAALNKGDDFILAIVEVSGAEGYAHAPRYVLGSKLDDTAPHFLNTHSTYNLKGLLDMSEIPS